MKLKWQDLITTLLVIVGGVIVYAKFYSYNWAIIGSWRSATTLLLIVGFLMFLFSRFNFANLSILNVSEMVLGVVAILMAVWGIFVVNHFVFYGLATVLGVLWLIDTARHARHGTISSTPPYNRHAPIH